MKVDIRMIFIYSDKKNKTNGMEECSVKNPPTRYDSASTRSIGGRLVSAIIAIRNSRTTGNNGRQYHTDC